MDQTDFENPTSRSSSQKSSRRSSSRRSQKSAGQHSSPSAQERRSKSKSSRQKHLVIDDKDAKKGKAHDHKVDVADERSNILGYEVYTGKLVFYNKKNKITSDDNQLTSNGKADAIDARLTSKALIWGSSVLLLEDAISVSYNSGVKHFTVHAYPTKKSLFGKARRVQKDFCFIASTLDEAILWATCFAEQNIYINLLPHPGVSGINQDSDNPLSESLFDQPLIKCKSPQRVLVILNPRSGHGRSSKVFHEKAEPIFKVIIGSTYSRD